MPRKLTDSWLNKYLEFAAITEAPRRMHFWSGVWALAGAVRRKIWIDMKRFTWYPSFYIVFVAPPGVVVKSSTADIAQDILSSVPGIKFGPNAITWQGLASHFPKAAEAFQWPPDSGDWIPMTPMSFCAAEMGSLINFQDRDMINLLIELWDGKKSYEKITKMSGNDVIERPWINILACTTPHAIADNMPIAVVGGGFSSRCVYLYADTKDKFIAYVDEYVGQNDEALKADLIHDLEYISMNLCGPMIITEAARKWGRSWYESFWKQASARMDDRMLEGYAARKQTHIHKLAMILSISKRDSLIIEEDDLQLANTMLEDLETDMPKVFSRIGRTEVSMQAEKFIAMVEKRGSIDYDEAYRVVHAHFPDAREFEGILSGAIKTGKIEMVNTNNGFVLRARKAIVLSAHNTDVKTEPQLPNADTATTAPNS